MSPLQSNQKFVFISHTNKVPNRTLTIIQHFSAEYSIQLINWQRNAEQKNNFERISNQNILASPGFSGMLRFYIQVIKLLRGVEMKLCYCCNLRLLPLAIFVARWKKAALIYDYLEIPSALVAKRLTEKLPFLSYDKVRVIVERLENLLIKQTDGVLVIDSKNETIINSVRKVQKNSQPIMNYPSKSIVVDIHEVAVYKDKFKGRKLIVYAGSMFAAKGLYKYLELVKLLKEDDPSVLLVLVGLLRFGENDEKIKEYIEEQGLKGHVAFLPWMQYTELLALLKHARLGLALHDPSFFYFQMIGVGNGRKVFTYIMSGVPVLVSLPELGVFVENNRIGFKADYEDVQSIYKAAKKVILDDQLFGTMSQNCLKLFREKCNWENEMSKVELVFTNALQER